MGLYISATRRDAIKTILGAAVGLGATSHRLFAAPALVPLGEDRFTQLDDKTSGIRIIEGLDFTLDQSLMPGNMGVLVRGDHVTLSGVISMPGLQVTIIARELTCVSGAMISTVGKVGDPNLKGQTASPQSNGSSAGSGKDGGRITVLVGNLIGTLTLDASGGSGGDAMNGGVGLQGSPGQNAGLGHAAGAGSQGHPGGLAGAPGAGGNGGDVAIGAIVASSIVATQCKSNGGTPGQPAVNGDPGAGGHGGTAASGAVPIYGPCP